MSVPPRASDFATMQPARSMCSLDIIPLTGSPPLANIPRSFMRIRPLHLLLLGALLFWASGAAMNLHERLEHGEAAIAKATAEASHDGNSKHRDPHEHDDCPTCQLLAHMQVDHVAPPILVCVHLPIQYLPQRPDRRPLIADALTFAPIRGPPQV